MLSFIRAAIGRLWPGFHPSGRSSGVWIGGGTSPFGVVSDDYARTLAAYFACVKVISEDIAKVPLVLYSRGKSDTRGRERATDHPLYELLHLRPNPQMSAMNFREALVAQTLIHGNGYAEIERTIGGRPIALWPIQSKCVMPQWNAQTGARQYLINGRYTISADDMLHVRGLGDDGLEGWSVARAAAEVVGCGLAQQRHGSSYYTNGARAGTVIEFPGTLREGQASRIANDWDERHRGPGGAFRTAVVDGGGKVHRMEINHADAQFLESRRFTVEEICRFFRVPPHKIAHLEHATFSNIEHQGIEYVDDTLVPWCVRIEQELALKVLKPAERGLYYWEHLLDALKRGDQNSRYGAYAVGRQWGFLSANDVRRAENLPPIEGGDVYLSPANMQPATALPGGPPNGLD